MPFEHGIKSTFRHGTKAQDLVITSSRSAIDRQLG
jgi:hypothetical protein